MLAVMTLQPSCRGCEKPQPQAQETPEIPQLQPQVTPLPQAPTPTHAYTGPTSKSPDGLQISTGFLNADGKPLPQPQAGAINQILTTALDAQGRPLQHLTSLDGQEMWGFLVAMDLRHVQLASAEGPVREAADARMLKFMPPGGGDHALVTVFQPEGGELQAVSTPVSISGHLPEVAGPGLQSLGMTARDAEGEVNLTLLPANPTPTAPLELRFHRQKQLLQPLYAVLLDPPLGRALVLQPGGGQGNLQWNQPISGEWLLLLAPQKGDRALAFRLSIAPMEQK